MEKRNAFRTFGILLPCLGILACLIFYFGFWTHSPSLGAVPLSQRSDETCTLGEIEAALMQDLRTGDGPSYRIGTMRFAAYAQEQAEGPVNDPRLSESENAERYQLYLAHYVAAENAALGRPGGFLFWRDMRSVTVSELKAHGLTAIWGA